MEIKIQKRDLLSILNKVSGVLSPKPTLPVLNHILIEAGKGVLVVTGTDLELSVKITKETVVLKEGKVLTPGRKLLEIAREFPEAEVGLYSEKENRLRISQGKIVLNLVGLRVDDFPLTPKIKNPNQFKITAGNLKKTIIYTRPVVVFDENKPNLSGIFFTTEDGWLTTVTTDTRRLARHKTKTNLSADIKFILPIKTADAIKSLWEEATELDVNLGTNQIIFSGEGLVLTSQIIEGEFPDYNSVIPKENDLATATIPLAAFVATLRRIKQVVSTGKNLVRLDLRKNNLKVSGETAGVGEGAEEIDISYQGEPITLNFNPDYLLEGVKSLDGEEAFFFGLNHNPEKPSLIRSLKGADYIYLVMAMRL
ncbi:MAG: DNA polymerase III subunit beta [Candidatus Omnitrophica bacterium]|nr:DNA polymerase III subunit beta [Candidatus Omnitrophota bacterium]